MENEKENTFMFTNEDIMNNFLFPEAWPEGRLNIHSSKDTLRVSRFLHDLFSEFHIVENLEDFTAEDLFPYYTELHRLYIMALQDKPFKITDPQLKAMERYILALSGAMLFVAAHLMAKEHEERDNG